MDSSKSPSSSIRLLRLQDELETPPPKVKSNLLLKLTAMTEALELVAKEAQAPENNHLSRKGTPLIPKSHLTLVR
ncbi:MAG: hypothetical protein WCI18_07010 [Pseudomonadota bacterium]